LSETVSRTVRITPHWRRVLRALLLAAYAVLWLGGVLSHALRGGVRAEQNWLAALFLFLAAALVMLGAETTRARLQLMLAALLGFGVELLGVHTSLPFGAYRYTDALRPQLFGVPLVMTCAWLALVAYTGQAATRAGLSRWVSVPLAALWLTAIDLIIDPLAAHELGYWRWAGAGAYYAIPASNFLGWFMTGLLTFVLWPRWPRNVWSNFVGLSIILFFALLALVHALYLAALVGAALCALHLLTAQGKTGVPAK
jgi:putative membrane protein